jgi:hypothetical protein
MVLWAINGNANGFPTHLLNGEHGEYCFVNFGTIVYAVA